MKTRFISAFIMLAIVIPLIIIGDLPFKIFASLVGAYGIYELINVRSGEKKIPLGITIIACIFMALLLFFSNDYLTTNNSIDFRIIIGAALLFLFPLVFINNNNKYNISDALYIIGGIVFLGLAFSSFILIREIDLAHIIYLVLITIITDTFAYFTGKFIGKHKLIEKISPKKTIEGSIGGAIVGTVIPVLFYIFVIDNSINIYLLVGITLLLSTIGQIGDLIFSSIKRHYNVKDFSNLIPGHGGILDRLDSIIFVVITYILFISIL